MELNFAKNLNVFSWQKDYNTSLNVIRSMPCTRDDPEAALRELLPKLDLSQPVWLPRHRADWDEYALTRFLPEHFMEAVPFDYMEISYIFPEDEKKAARPRDPRWDA